MDAPWVAKHDPGVRYQLDGGMYMYNWRCTGMMDLCWAVEPVEGCGGNAARIEDFIVV